MSDLIDLRVRTRNTYIKIDPNSKVWDVTTLDFFINEWYKKIQKDMWFDIPECQASTTITTASWVTEYSKPTDFQKLTWIYQDWYWLTRTTKQDFLINRATQSKPSSYYIYGSKIWLYPTPDSTYTIDLLYNKYLPKLTNTQWTLLPDDYDEAIALYASYLAMMSVEKQAKATMCLAQYNSEINWLLWQYLNDDDNISFSIQRTNDRVRDDAL